MTGLFSRLARRSLGAEPTLRPRLASRFEPMPGAGESGASGLEVTGESPTPRGREIGPAPPTASPAAASTPGTAPSPPAGAGPGESGTPAPAADFDAGTSPAHPGTAAADHTPAPDPRAAPPAGRPGPAPTPPPADRAARPKAGPTGVPERRQPSPETAAPRPAIPASHDGRAGTPEAPAPRHARNEAGSPPPATGDAGAPAAKSGHPVAPDARRIGDATGAEGAPPLARPPLASPPLARPPRAGRPAAATNEPARPAAASARTGRLVVPNDPGDTPSPAAATADGGTEASGDAGTAFEAAASREREFAPGYDRRHREAGRTPPPEPEGAEAGQRTADTAPPQAPVVEVHIGRIEVTARPAPRTGGATRPGKAAGRVASLSDYLSGRGGSGTG